MSGKTVFFFPAYSAGYFMRQSFELIWSDEYHVIFFFLADTATIFQSLHMVYPSLQKIGGLLWSGSYIVTPVYWELLQDICWSALLPRFFLLAPETPEVV